MEELAAGTAGRATKGTSVDMPRTLQAVIARLAAAGVRPSDPDEVRLYKATLSLTAALISAMGLIWTGMYAALGLYRAATVPFAYAAISMVSLPLAAATNRFGPFRVGQLLMMAILPFVLQWQLGGMGRSGAVMVWSFWTPLYALITGGRREWQGWLAAFVALVALSGVLEERIAALAAPIAPVLRAAFTVTNIGGLALVTMLLMRYVVRERDAAQQRSEHLLLNILPQPIAQRLKRDPGAIADGYEEVTVLFADLVDFTRYSANRVPRQLVNALNEMFSEFDHLAERFGLEKIKTVGDAYMAVAGLPTPRPDHAGAAAEMALAMQQAMAQRAARTGEGLRLRIGMHSGPVVAGVIGRKKFSYDLWGDTVNIASRMESHGVPGQIQITPETRARLLDQYLLEERGPLPVKGMGEMTTYVLLGRRDGAPAAPG